MQPPILGWNAIKVWWRSNMFVCLICLRCFRYGTTFQALWFTCFIANRGLKHHFLGWNKTFSPRSNPAGSVENDPVTTTILRDPTKYSFLGQIVLGPPTQKIALEDLKPFGIPLLWYLPLWSTSSKLCSFGRRKFRQNRWCHGEPLLLEIWFWRFWFWWISPRHL